jgi:hypothetical protein
MQRRLNTAAAIHQMAKRKQKVPEEIKQFWRLLDMSLDAHWNEINTLHLRGRAADFTVEALMFSLRRGPEELARPDTLNRLAQLSEQQLLEVITRLQAFKPEIAPAWSDVDLEALIAVRRRL